MTLQENIYLTACKVTLGYAQFSQIVYGKEVGLFTIKAVNISISQFKDDLRCCFFTIITEPYLIYWWLGWMRHCDLLLGWQPGMEEAWWVGWTWAGFSHPQVNLALFQPSALYYLQYGIKSKDIKTETVVKMQFQLRKKNTKNTFKEKTAG